MTEICVDKKCAYTKDPRQFDREQTQNLPASGETRIMKDHQSYLLRLWPTQVHGETTWRAELVRIPDMQGSAFANLEHLLEYLKAQTGPIAPETSNDVVGYNKADLLE